MSTIGTVIFEQGEYKETVICTNEVSQVVQCSTGNHVEMYRIESVEGIFPYWHDVAYDLTTAIMLMHDGPVIHTCRISGCKNVVRYKAVYGVENQVAYWCGDKNHIPSFLALMADFIHVPYQVVYMTFRLDSGFNCSITAYR